MIEQPLRPTLDTVRQTLLRAVHHRYFILTCLVSSVVLRLLWVWLVRFDQVLDFKWYYERAVSIAIGNGYSVNGTPTGYWPIGYPGFLAGLFYLFRPSVFLAQIANVALYEGVILLAYYVSRKTFALETAARMTLLLLSFYPNHIAYTSILSSEILFVFLALVGVALFIGSAERWSFLLLAGLACGAAVLTKPQMLPVPALYAGMLSRNTRDFVKSALILYLVVFAAITPSMVRNYVVLGTAALATDGGLDLLDGNNPYATGRHNFSPAVNNLLGDLRTEPFEYMFDGREVQRDFKARTVAIDYLVSHPWRTISRWPRKFVALYLSDVDGIYYSLGMTSEPQHRTKYAFVVTRVIAELYYALMLGLCCVSWPDLLRERNRRHLLGLSIIAYFTLLYLMFIGNARYHFPVMPWVAIYAGVAGARLLTGRPMTAAAERTGHE